MAATGNEIVVTPNPLGRFIWGILSGTPKPGTCMEISPGVVRTGNGHLTYRVYTAGGTHGERRPILVLDRDKPQGGLATTAYTTGQLICMYAPITGEEMNVLKSDITGTGSASDDFDEGDMLMLESGTGKVIKSAANITGFPESEPFQAVEPIVDPTADTLVWVMATGV